ncbi:hypothetical protein D3C72_2109670 [compost metagenome]
MACIGNRFSTLTLARMKRSSWSSGPPSAHEISSSALSAEHRVMTSSIMFGALQVHVTSTAAISLGMSSSSARLQVSGAITMRFGSA